MIPVANPDLSSKERDYLLEAFDSGWIGSHGTFVDRLESKFSDLIGTRYAEAVSNGTAALHLALTALGVESGDEVLVPALTYVASANAVTYTGGVPVFVDVDPNTLNPTASQVEQRITDRTVGLILVHLYGNPARLDEMVRICDKYGLFLLEDAAQALGASFRGKPAGSWGDVATFSFYGNKTLTTGEGGMVVSDETDLINRIAKLKNQGQSSMGGYWHDMIGYNYRLTNLQAAVGVAQVERCHGISERKKKITRIYRRNISHPDVRFQRVEDEGEHGGWMNVVLFAHDMTVECERCQDELKERGIETRPIFPPVPELPPYRRGIGSYPGAYEAAHVGFCLPSGPSLSEDDLIYVCEQLSDIL